MPDTSPLTALRRPEYTGERRCWPCTVVNLGILGLVAAVVWAVAGVAVALAVAVAGGTVVWIRGYLVPYTPRFAPRLVGAVPGGDALFHDDGAVPERTDSLGDDADAADGERLLERLIEAGVLTVETERVLPTAAFEQAWHDEMDALADHPTAVLSDAVAEVADARQTRVVEHEDGEWVALGDEGTDVVEETWLTRPVAIAEVGATRVLDDYLSDPDTIRAAASTLRMFLQSCPDCGTTLEEGSAVDCCGGYNGPSEVPEETLVCPDCRTRLFTFE